MINEFRRSRRRKVADTVLVVDTMLDSVAGRLGNLSETGMLLMASAQMVEDALYQFRFNLHDARGATISREVVAVVTRLVADHEPVPTDGRALARSFIARIPGFRLAIGVTTIPRESRQIVASLP